MRQRKRRRRLLSSKQRDGTAASFALLMDQKQKVAPAGLQRASWAACAARLISQGGRGKGADHKMYSGTLKNKASRPIVNPISGAEP